MWDPTYVDSKMSADVRSDQKSTSSLSKDEAANKTSTIMQPDEPGVAKIKHE